MVDVETQDFWSAMNKEKVLQRSVKIPSRNGTDFVAGQEIIIQIDPSLKYFDPSECYLEGFVKINMPSLLQTNPLAQDGATPTRLQLDAEIGAQVLCRTIRISDRNGVELESIENYNTMVALKYDYQTNDSLRGKRALTECSSFYNSENRATRLGTKSHANNLNYNPFSEVADTDALSASFSNTNSMIDAKFCIPLHTGIFGSESKVFPNAMLGGIQISILLEDTNRVFRQLDSVMRYRRLTCNPEFLGKTVGGASVGLNGSFNTFILNDRNSQHDFAQQCPFVVGERLGFQRFVAGNASIVEFVSASGVPVIKEISVDTDLIKITLNSSVKVNTIGFDSNLSPIFVYSRSVNDAPSYDATYNVKDVNLIVGEVIPSPQVESQMMADLKAGGKMVYDFMSVRNYKHSQLATDRVNNIRIPLQESKAKALFCIPTDGTVYSSKEAINASNTYKIKKTESTVGDLDYYLRSNRSGLEGISDFITNYQFLYNGRLQPNRRVPLSKVSTGISIDAQHLIELNKCLSSSKIFGHSFQRFNQNFVIGRALALGEGVYDARNKDFVLQVEYNETAPPTKNKLWMNFCFHIRTIEIEANGNVRVIT
tara:strand:- start:2263 stop:4056 length:1794 start_codon:yes stop_codon:yes gene_type:complete